MIRRATVVITLIALAVAACHLASAQQPPTTLTIDLGNVVEYQDDIYDPAKFARNANVTPSLGIGTGILNFAVVTLIGDIVAVNGQPAKGIYAGRSRTLNANASPKPGSAIADIMRVAIREHIFEILQPDGTPIGTIMATGLSGGNAPPGQDSTERANWAIAGGTGAFLGARGQVEGTGGAGRAASMAEDPANRRLNGGNPSRYFLHIIPMTVPQVETIANGPAVFHSDFSAVTAAKPARAGEVLIVRATGLGPTVPGVDPGQPFPTDLLQPVNSPVAVTVNGQAAAVVNALGWPGLVDSYRVDFRVPDGAAAGTAAIQLSAAWIAGPSANIPIQ